MLRPLVQRQNVLILALAAACLGVFLFVANLAEHPHERRTLAELTLIAPLALYIAAGLRKLVR